MCLYGVDLSKKNTRRTFFKLMVMHIGAFFDWITTFYALDPGVNVD